MSNNWHIDQSPARRSTQDIVVLGAGIAGCTTAAALTQRGFNVRLIDRHPLAGCEASGNPQAIVYPKLSPREDLLPRFNLSAMQFASRYYKPFWEQGLGEQCGVIVVPESDKIKSDFEIIGQRFKDQPDFVQLLNNKALCKFSGINLQASLGLYFSQLGWLPPAAICQQLLSLHQIPLIKADIQRIEYIDHRWQLFGTDKQPCLTTETLVIANAFGCRQFQQTDFLPVSQLRGQVSQIPTNTAISALKTVICGQGYITPQQHGLHSIGATYNKGLFTTAVRTEDHQTNLDQICSTDAGIANAIGAQTLTDLSGRANYRCTTKDYLPIVGAVPDLTQMIKDYGSLRHNAKANIEAGGSYLPNLYINCGMGSRGLSYAPLSAEILASELAGETAILDEDLRLALHPARFMIRDLKKKRL
ncbi:MAG: FAD-dependent 5-carboxymethylaminomethyl-2-thiouridine(34) oxidoreductase MnmC [Porticoccaceae bacterium]|nr:FAD-dependent 5-carboxymethylaminomethyl-2-thiouridine(34) oxidoreductase MnmC [Porticoccaceae bacterium]